MEIINGILKSIDKDDIIDGKVIIPEGVTTIIEEAFTRNHNIISVFFPKSLRTIEVRAFKECKNLREVHFNEGLLEIKESAFAFCFQLEEVILPDSVTSIKNAAFYECEAITKIKLPKNLKVIESYTFDRCKKLENILLSETLEEIKEYAFFECDLLKRIRIPEKVRIINQSTFFNCKSLVEVELPDHIEEIKDAAFAGCKALKRIDLKEFLINIGASSFMGCTNLEEIKFPNTLESIGSYAFKECKSIKEIEIPSKVSVIERNSFSDCYGLEKITLHDHLACIQKNAFSGSQNLKEIEIKDSNGKIKSTYSLDEKEMLLEKTPMIITVYLYLYANSILKEKYQSTDEMLENKDILLSCYSDRFCYGNAIEKFKNIFYKLRREYDIPIGLLYFLSPTTAKEFSYSIWNEIKNCFVFRDNEVLEKALAEMIEIFGLFHKDKNQEKRIKQFKKMISYDHVTITESEMKCLLEDFYYNQEEILNDFTKKEENVYFLQPGIRIDEEFKMYLTYKISEKKLKKLRKITGTYGKRLNDFIRENYKKESIKVYELKEDAFYKDEIVEYLSVNDIFNHLNYSDFHRIFDGCSGEYEEAFYQFFIENLEFIYGGHKIQSKIKEIRSHFSLIQKYYLTQAGITEINLKQALDYLSEKPFDYHDGNYEFQEEAKKAGIVNQERFNFYQELFEKNQTRKMSSLIKRSNIYEIDGYVIKAELLRKDDSLSMFVGETNYTNCCQIFNGIGHNCMAHAINSADGGIFVTKLLKDGEWVLLTESWDWQNNNLYCHDNIEGTPYFKEAEESLKAAVAKVFQLDAEEIIKKSKEEVESYIKERRKRLEKSVDPLKEQELEKLKDLEKKEVIKLVTSGSSYDDLGLDQYFDLSLSVNQTQIINGKVFTLENFQPVNYNSSKPYFDPNHLPYSDAKDEQYILAGSLEDLVLERLEEIEPIYRDERRVQLELNGDIKNFTTKKVQTMKSTGVKEDGQNFEPSQISFEDKNVYLGEDWYLIYEIENNTVHISDFARVKPSLEDEQGKQYQEIINAVSNLVNSYDQIEVELKENSSYLLYLLNKKLGYIEQIGEDISYLEGSSDIKIVTDIEQEEMLRNIKDIKTRKQDENIIHKVIFKKKEKFESEKKRIK